MPFGELVVVKEFSEELAGERVGWANVREYECEDQEPIIIADVVTATVGESGASLTHYVREEDGEIRTSAGPQNNEGFTAVNGLSVLLRRGQDMLHPSTVSCSHSEHGRMFGEVSTLLWGAQNIFDYRPQIEDAAWTEGSDAIRNQLIEGLKVHEIEDLYPLVYYLYNLHTAFPDKVTYIEQPQATKARLLPDPEMKDLTRNQIDTTREIVLGLTEIKATDVEIEEIIDQHGSGQLPELVNKFVESRKAVADKETELRVLRDRLIVPYFGYLPVGFRPQGRTWPYMDPVATSENEAFGHEVDALRNKNRGIPSNELDREIKELNFRIEHARKNLATLALLETAESEAVSARRLAAQ